VEDAHVLEDRLEQPLERRPLYESLRGLLIPLDLSEGHGARPEAMGTLLLVLLVLALELSPSRIILLLELRVFGRNVLGISWPSLRLSDW
jgi:hypothetical protein